MNTNVHAAVIYGLMMTDNHVGVRKNEMQKTAHGIHRMVGTVCT